VDKLVNHENYEVANLVTTILMDDERHVLSNWERKNIFIRSKKSDLSKMVLDAIYNIRRILIEQKINSLIAEFGAKEERDKIMESIVDYNNLKTRLFERLNRVV
jgi:DNA primase